MNYHHLTIEERSCIRKYYVDGLSYREIARLIGRNVSTVSRELRRNCTHMYDIPTYYPHTAQKKYLLRRSYCHRGMFWDHEVIEYINEKLRATWSPEQIACTPCELKMPSWRTIYRWIYEKYLVNGNLKVLQRKGKSHGSRETRGKYSKVMSIRKRDKSVYSRKEAGHWEADTVLPRNYGTSSSIPVALSLTSHLCGRKAVSRPACRTQLRRRSFLRRALDRSYCILPSQSNSLSTLSMSPSMQIERGAISRGA